MAYISQEQKKEKAEQLKPILKKYGIKGRLSINHYSSLVLKINSGVLDFIGNYNKMQDNKSSGEPILVAKDSLSVNQYWYKSTYSGEVLDCLEEIMSVMFNGNHDNSDLQTDYFDVGWYVDVNVGQWDKPYKLEVAK